MKFILSIVLLLGLSVSSRAQQIDSFSYIEIPNGDTFFYFRITFPNNHFRHLGYGTGIVSESPRVANFAIFFLECDTVVRDLVWEDSIMLVGEPEPWTLNLIIFADTGCGPGYSSSIPIVDQKTLIIGSTTGISSPAADLSKSITLTPNPASDVVRVSSSGPKIQGIQVYNVAGQRVLMQKDTKSPVSVGHLPSGFYTVLIETDSGPLRQKLVIQH